MLCTRPLTVVSSTGPQQVACGQCFNCSINKRREWTARVLLEGLAAEKSGAEVTWSTLTYAEEAVPTAARGLDGQVARTLRKGDYQRLFKRLRKKDRLGPFRFALVGEYGTRSTRRPHYHVLFFGPSTARVDYHLQKEWAADYGFADAINWRMGKRQGSDAALSRACYIANYVTKKMHQVDHLEASDARIPEFAQTSQSPPLGYSRILLDLCKSTGGEFDIAETGDVPRQVRIEGRIWPLGKVLRARLRDDLGIPQLERERHAIIRPTRPRQQPTAEDYHRARLQSEKLQRLQSQSEYGRL